MLEAKILRNEPLARHTTLRLGGPAEYFVRVDARAELVEAVRWARAQHLEIFILGNGSNILVGDGGIRGIVIENHADEVSERELPETNQHRARVRVLADSGASLPGLANRLARQGWRGLEWAIGVPATVGAAVVTNAGAHGGAVSHNLVSAEILDSQNEDLLRAGQAQRWTREDLQYDYRTSFLKQHANRYVVLGVEFELTRDDPATCIARMNQYTEHRRRTQPTEPSVGSMFKNPPGDFAGRLIEGAGLKGTQVGKIQVSNVHANFFVNLGGGTAKQVNELVEQVRTTVREKFDIELELEIQFVGNQEPRTNDQ